MICIPNDENFRKKNKNIYKISNIDINSPRYNPFPHLHSRASVLNISSHAPITVPVFVLDRNPGRNSCGEPTRPQRWRFNTTQQQSERDERKRREPHKGAVFAANTCFVPRYKRWSAALIARFHPTRVKRGYPNA